MRKSLLFGFLGSFLMVGCSVNKINDPSIQTYKLNQKIECNQDRKIVLVGGCFDVIHHGHISFLKEARAQGDFLIVALEPDERIIKGKQRQPVHTQIERAKNLSHLRSVDVVLMLPQLVNFDHYAQLVKDVSPNIIAITKGDPMFKEKSKHAQNVGATIKPVIARLEKFSTTQICKGRS